MTEQTELRRDQLPPDRPRQGRPVRRTPASGARCRRPSTARSSSTSPRAASLQAGQRPVLARPRGLPRGQRLLDRPGHRRCQGADRRVPDRSTRDRSRSPTAHTADRIGDQQADLYKGYWSQIGVDTTVETVPQDQFITNALFGAAELLHLRLAQPRRSRRRPAELLVELGSALRPTARCR